MYGTYYKKNKKIKNKLFSSFVPIVFLLIIGGFVGKTLIKNSETKETISNLKPNYIQANLTKESFDLAKNNGTNSNDSKNGNDESTIKKNTDNKKNNLNTEVDFNINIQDNVTKSSSSREPVTFDSSVAFIGDSRTQGFIIYNGLKNVQDYSYIGLMVDTAISKAFVKTNNGQKITLLQDMKNKNIDSVYIMLGINELGWSYPQVFKVKYKELINEIRKVKPNCKIYIQSIIPVTKSRSESDKIFNNENIAKFNNLVQEVANEENVTYLDVESALVNSQGYLPEEASTDGIHLEANYCKKWLEYLKYNS